MNRRTFMGAAALVISSPVAALPVSNELESLIEQHKVLWERDEGAWDKVGNLDCHPDLRDFVPRVTLCNGKYSQIYGYTNLEIDQYIDRSLETKLLFVKNDEIKASIMDKADVVRNRYKEELAKQEAHKKEVQRSIGREKAFQFAEKCSDETREIEGRILAYQPKTLHDAALIASFVISVIKSGNGYLEIDQALDALRTIANTLVAIPEEVAA
ncbi:hypothetical protein [Brucella anthropi]|uniref:hypothetical protein n=1 Tax=Brucella anthropi TaxID=529 RepID=UPI003D98185D